MCVRCLYAPPPSVAAAGSLRCSIEEGKEEEVEEEMVEEEEEEMVEEEEEERERVWQLSSSRMKEGRCACEGSTLTRTDRWSNRRTV